MKFSLDLHLERKETHKIFVGFIKIMDNEKNLLDIIVEWEDELRKLLQQREDEETKKKEEEEENKKKDSEKHKKERENDDRERFWTNFIHLAVTLALRKLGG